VEVEGDKFWEIDFLPKLTNGEKTAEAGFWLEDAFDIVRISTVINNGAGMSSIWQNLLMLYERFTMLSGMI
jgi:hypothetical protein